MAPVIKPAISVHVTSTSKPFCIIQNPKQPTINVFIRYKTIPSVIPVLCITNQTPTMKTTNIVSSTANDQSGM